MRAGIGFCRRYTSGVAAAAVLTLGVSAYGQSMTLVPLSSTGPSVIAGQQITIPAGGVDIEFEIVLDGWSQAMPAQQLGAAQAAIDAAGYLGANAVPSNPGADIIPKGYALPDPAGGTRTQGAFQVTKICNGNLRNCSSGQPPCAGPEGICIDNNRFIHFNLNPVNAIATNTIAYEFASASGTAGQGTVDGSPSEVLGNLIVVVPVNAAGTYSIGFNPNPNNSFITDQDANAITPITFVPGLITITTGRCCFGLGGGAPGCVDGVTATQCNAQPGPRVFTAGANCAQGCVECIDNNGCRDRICDGGANSGGPCAADVDCGGGVCLVDNLCTGSTCTALFTCDRPLLYNDAVACCDPAVGPNGGLETIDDGDPCTDDVCDEGTGDVAHNGTTGNACDDGFACTTPDTCNAGVCEGVDVNTLPCAVDADCPLGECTGAGGTLCECSEDTPLCVLFEDGPFADGNCYEEGGTVNATVSIGAGSEQVSGGQFLVTYDNTCLTAVSVGPCAGDLLFTNVIEATIDNAAGEIFYAVTSDPGTMANEATPGPYDVACIVFTKIGDCSACDVCLTDDNPRNTMLTNTAGNRVPLASCGCSKEIRTSGEITLDTPDDADVNADCSEAYGTVTWNATSASDTCEGPLAVDCAAQHVGGLPVNHLISTGGIFPQGTTFFTCTASNTCGSEVTNVWTVNVSDQHTLDVEVHLQPVMNNAGVFNRAITFELYADCVSEPTEVCEVMSFQGPYNFAGHATATLKVDKGNYLCITAKDCLHTLREIADVECVNNQWTAVFKGDPIQGGNWLIGGNLDGCKADAAYGDQNAINILDFGTFMAELAAGAAYPPSGDTDCNTPHPHGDINADGVVDNLDYAFIVDNFLKDSKDLCCPGPAIGGPAFVEANLITSISVKELRAIGRGELAVGDLNKDGMLDLDDMAAYMQGTMPTAQPTRKGGNSTRGTR